MLPFVPFILFIFFFTGCVALGVAFYVHAYYPDEQAECFFASSFVAFAMMTLASMTYMFVMFW